MRSRTSRPKSASPSASPRATTRRSGNTPIEDLKGVVYGWPGKSAQPTERKRRQTPYILLAGHGLKAAEFSIGRTFRVATIARDRLLLIAEEST